MHLITPQGQRCRVRTQPLAIGKRPGALEAPRPFITITHAACLGNRIVQSSWPCGFHRVFRRIVDRGAPPGDNKIIKREQCAASIVLILETSAGMRGAAA
ncbi:MAG: hypothetical protein ACP5LD_10935 [Desulfomonilaceae bacterium]